MLACNSTGTSLGDSQFGLEMINTLKARTKYFVKLEKKPRSVGSSFAVRPSVRSTNRAAQAAAVQPAIRIAMAPTTPRP